MGKENQRVAVTKRMLREGLLRLLEKKDLEKISITELCTEAGINRVTFYRHYETPNDVLVEMEKELLDELQHAAKTPRSLPEFQQYLEVTCSFLDTHMDLLKIMIRYNTDSDFYSLFNSAVQGVWEESGLTGVLGKLSVEDRDFLSMYCAGGTYFVLRQWLLGNIKKTPQEIAVLAYNLLCNTDWSETGRRLALLQQKMP